MKKLLVIFMLVATFLSPLVVPSVVGAQFDPLEKPCQDITDSDDAQDICNESSEAIDTDPLNGDNGIITDIANLLALIAAIIAVVVIIIAGITMMTSGGDAGKVASSRNTIIYTVIGLVVIIVARTIVVFVFERLRS